MPHTARQVGHERSRAWPGRCTGGTCRGPTVASRALVTLDSVRMRTCAASIFSMTLSDARGRGESSPSRRYARVWSSALACQNMTFCAAVTGPLSIVAECTMCDLPSIALHASTKFSPASSQGSFPYQAGLISHGRGQPHSACGPDVRVRRSQDAAT
jgi:hypothetical protein